MPHCLIAIGSNLGDRASQLRRAVAEISRSPRTRLVARSAWHETPPVGGPEGQGAFLNAAALAATSLTPSALHRELRRIETTLGRVRTDRWGPRSLDLDLLLYEGAELRTPELEIPHPRMAFRRFVLEPASEVAPWMVHPESGWTVQRLLEHINQGADVVAVAAADDAAGQQVVSQIRGQLPAGGPSVASWTSAIGGEVQPRPKLIMAVGEPAGVDARQRRKMLHLPPDGPIAWMAPETSADPLHEAMAAIQSVWPALATWQLTSD